MAAEATNAPVRRECMTVPRFAAPAGSLADTASPTRRALIGGAGLAAIVVAAPAIGAVGLTGPTDCSRTLDANDAARHRFNTLPDHLEDSDPVAFAIEERRMHDASAAADRAVPTTWGEFVRLLDYFSSGGDLAIDRELSAVLLAHATRLLSGKA